mgnify:CR=1 FL=1
MNETWQVQSTHIGLSSGQKATSNEDHNLPRIQVFLSHILHFGNYCYVNKTMFRDLIGEIVCDSLRQRHGI